MKTKMNKMLHALFCFALILGVYPAAGASAAPGDLVNVALAETVTITANENNPPNETAEKLIDQNQNTKWLGRSNANLWIQVQFKNGDTQAVTKYSLTTANDAPGRDPKNWRVEGSNDGKTWDIIDEQTNQFAGAARFSTEEYTIASNKAEEYAYYRLYITANNGEPLTQLADWKLFAIELDDAASVSMAMSKLDLGDTSALKKGLALPVGFVKGTSIRWESSNQEYMTNQGKIRKRPGIGQPDVSLMLTATISKGSASQTKTFPVTILALTAADFEYKAGIDFESGLEEGDPPSTDTAEPNSPYRILALTKNMGAICCGIGGMESKKGSPGMLGSGSLLYSGNALDANSSHAYNSVFEVEIVVRPSTRLSYWVYPEKKPSVLPEIARTTSKYAALDLLFTDGTYLHELNALDQHGVALHPNAQGKGGFVVEDQWNYISANIGSVANGKTIDKILFGFDSSTAASGYFRGFVDEIVIEHDSNIDEENMEAVLAAKDALDLGDLSAVSGDLSLPAEGEQGTTIAWTSSNPGLIGHDGKLAARPLPGLPNGELTLTATIQKGKAAAAKAFTVVVLALTDAEAVALDQAQLDLGDISAVASDLLLPAKGGFGSAIAWNSSEPGTIDSSGKVSRPNQDDKSVVLTATMTSGSERETKTFEVLVVALGDNGDVASDTAALNLGDLSAVTDNIFLPEFGQQGSAISWGSSKPHVIDEKGRVARPAPGSGDEGVTLTAALTKGAASRTKEFAVTVKALTADEAVLLSAVRALDLPSADAVKENLNLPAAIGGEDGVVVFWESSHPGIVNYRGEVARPRNGDPDVTVALTATLRYGASSVKKSFAVTVKAIGAEELSSDAALKDLRVNFATIAGFDPGKLEYNYELPAGTERMPSVTAMTYDPYAHMTIAHAKTATGTTEIRVTAEDGSANTYKIHFTEHRGNDATLKAIFVDGRPLAEFERYRMEYDVKLPEGMTQVPTVTAATYDPNAQTVITPAAALPGTATIRVTSEDGSTVNTYAIHFTVDGLEEPEGTDATLTSIELDGRPLAEFERYRMEYEVELPAGTSIAPTVTAVAYDPNSHKLILPAEALPGTATIRVTSEDGAAANTYEIHFTVKEEEPKGTDATLKEIYVGGKALSRFDQHRFIYDVTLPAGTKRAPEVTAAASDSKASVRIKPAQRLPGVTEIVVTAEDGITSLTYRIHFTVQSSSPDSGGGGNPVYGVPVHNVAKQEEKQKVEERPRVDETDRGEEGKTPERHAPQATLSDIAAHWAKEAIEKAVRLGFVTGYEDGTFRPNAEVTRAEFAAMLARAMKWEGDGASLSFADRDAIPAWAGTSVAGAVKAGMIQGYDDNTFRSARNVTRAEIAAMIVRALGLKVNPDAELTFADTDRVPAWAVPYVAAAAEAGLMQGRGNNQFAPGDNAARAEAVTLILAMLESK
ncbi:hypothetical protein PAE9249_00877 [Paenibacillus sp. CECT 9249]|uniref:immunoglobulin-like domain-containing protein n=1 Tax=Paenibacillus sp. CECT 9249 TaxID=2845385 RepID=UPI001E3D396B|nr:immunoglobulin-like domain-containing protein [Paenibacillus sp. CECT 9249]CAH0118390.1 hypothetical protein PAE9249_00877 [Paenibacillus sp. CECT 9249]